jgi:hypothetical protein
MKRLVLVALALGACKSDGPVTTPDAAVDPDPLDITTAPAPGSLDDLHEKIISKRCSGQPGLCHNGQFEPNLSTPGLMYAYLVNRPGLEKPDHLRVAPGNSAQSLFVDKIRNRGVATQMPLGAEPLAEEDMKALEKWIDDGALRAPGAAPAPVLNNPPKKPEIAIFSTGGTRLDGTGPVTANVGTTLVLRHSVQDFETPDASIPFAAFVLGVVGTNNEVVLDPARAMDQQVGQTAFDAAGPMGKGDLLNFKRSFAVTNPMQVRDRATKAITSIDPRGVQLAITCVYIDSTTKGIVAVDTSTTMISIP